jgi:type 1 glutamine amidotransferase
VHENIAASVEALKEICEAIGVSCEVSDNPEIFDESFQENFNAVIFSNTNNEAFNNEGQKKVFKEFIQNGGGFIGIHSACGSEREWPWFWAMVGGKFVRHPPYQPFEIKIINKNHLSTEFLPDTWAWADECYFMNNLNPDIKVLLAVDLTTIDDPELEKYPGNTFGNLFPLAWFHTYDGGREFFTALGHDIEHYTDYNFIKHLTGGIRWVLEL